MSIAFFGQGMTNLGWTVVSDIAPKKLIGLTGGIFNFSANLAGIVTPLVIGVTFQTDRAPFVGTADLHRRLVALLGAFAYSVILGRHPRGSNVAGDLKPRARRSTHAASARRATHCIGVTIRRHGDLPPTTRETGARGSPSHRA